MNHNKDYSDIINMKHHVSTVHPQMSMHDRAAQFSPFSALTGYNECINESKRLTEKRIELEKDKKDEINEKLMILKNDKSIQTEITYFVKDDKKSGGKYITEKGYIKKIDELNNNIVMDSGTYIYTDDIIDIKETDR